MRRALRVATDIVFLTLLAIVAGQVVARPFAPYEQLVKPWLPGFCDVIFAVFLLLAVRDALRSEPDRSLLSRTGARIARWTKESPRAAEAIGAAFVLGIVLAVSLALYDRGIVPIDEGLHVQGASEVLHGRQLYRDIVLVYPPGYFYLTAGIFELFGESLWVMRVFSIVLQVALSAAMWALVRKTSQSPLFALLAGALMLAFGLPQGHFLTTAAWLAVLASLVALRAFALDARGLWLTGAFVAITALFKQDNGAFLFGGLAIAALLSRREQALSRAGVLVRLGLPSVIMAAATVSFLRVRGVSFADQWACLVARPFRFEASASHALPIPDPFDATIAYLPILIYMIAATTLISERRRGERPEPAIVAAIVYGLFLHTGYWARADLWHLAYALPPAFVAAPKALDGAMRWLALARRPLFSGACVGLVLPIGFTLYNLEKYPVVQAVVARWRTKWEPLESERARGIWAEPYVRGQIDGAVRWIQEKCAPNESFFVAPISPILYFLADRPPAARFILITANFGTSIDEQATIIDDLRRNRPKLLLYSRELVDGKSLRERAPNVYRACFEGRPPEHAFGDFLSFPGMP
ncbi:MAG: glycosyltransferase family 39 protein [Planctomycetes bacterium]|nr:glycosyltransferase family 39 protein [Planctomycetota bacterium]